MRCQVQLIHCGVNPAQVMKLFARKKSRAAFTLVEALVVVAIVAIVAALLLPALSKARERGLAMACLGNTRQMNLGWQLYADDYNSLLPYNLTMAGTMFRTNLNWVNNVMTWDLSSDNTNTATITQAALGAFICGLPAVYHCPSDRLLSGSQAAAGWDERIRSYSMNAFAGNPGAASPTGFQQFLKITDIPKTSEIFVFLDENPDSINDGSFSLNKKTSIAGVYSSSVATAPMASDVPASYHNGSTTFTFADGHSSLHRWSGGSFASVATAAGPVQPATATAADSADVQWLTDHTSVAN